MADSQTGRQAPSRAVTARGAEHVRLSYDYLECDYLECDDLECDDLECDDLECDDLECDDIDGYGSLLDDDVEVDRPDTPLGRGRAEVIRMPLDRVIPRAWNALSH